MSVEQEEDAIDDDLSFTAMENGNNKAGGARGRAAGAARSCGGHYYLGPCNATRAFRHIVEQSLSPSDLGSVLTMNHRDDARVVQRREELCPAGLC